MGAFERVIEGCHVIRQGRQWYWSCEDIQSFGQQRPDNIVPTRAVSPCTVHQHDTRSSRGLAHIPSPSCWPKLTGTLSKFADVAERHIPLIKPGSREMKALGDAKDFADRQIRALFSGTFQNVLAGIAEAITRWDGKVVYVEPQIGPGIREMAAANAIGP